MKEKLVNKENIPINTEASTSEVKEKAVAEIEEPPFVTTTYNKPESSATAYEKVSILSSLPTSVAAAFASLDNGEQHEESITLKADDYAYNIISSSREPPYNKREEGNVNSTFLEV